MQQNNTLASKTITEIKKLFEEYLLEGNNFCKLQILTDELEKRGVNVIVSNNSLVKKEYLPELSRAELNKIYEELVASDDNSEIILENLKNVIIELKKRQVSEKLSILSTLSTANLKAMCQFLMTEDSDSDVLNEATNAEKLQLVIAECERRGFNVVLPAEERKTSINHELTDRVNAERENQNKLMNIPATFNEIQKFFELPQQMQEQVDEMYQQVFVGTESNPEYPISILELKEKLDQQQHTRWNELVNLSEDKVSLTNEQQIDEYQQLSEYIDIFAHQMKLRFAKKMVERNTPYMWKDGPPHSMVQEIHNRIDRANSFENIHGGISLGIANWAFIDWLRKNKKDNVEGNISKASEGSEVVE